MQIPDHIDETGTPYDAFVRRHQSPVPFWLIEPPVRSYVVARSAEPEKLYRKIGGVFVCTEVFDEKLLWSVVEIERDPMVMARMEQLLRDRERVRNRARRAIETSFSTPSVRKPKIPKLDDSTRSHESTRFDTANQSPRVDEVHSKSPRRLKSKFDRLVRGPTPPRGFGKKATSTIGGGTTDADGDDGGELPQRTNRIPGIKCVTFNLEPETPKLHTAINLTANFKRSRGLRLNANFETVPRRSMKYLSPGIGGLHVNSSLPTMRIAYESETETEFESESECQYDMKKVKRSRSKRTVGHRSLDYESETESECESVHRYHTRSRGQIVYTNRSTIDVFDRGAESEPEARSTINSRRRSMKTFMPVSSGFETDTERRHCPVTSTPNLVGRRGRKPREVASPAPNTASPIVNEPNNQIEEKIVPSPSAVSRSATSTPMIGTTSPTMENLARTAIRTYTRVMRHRPDVDVSQSESNVNSRESAVSKFLKRGNCLKTVSKQIREIGFLSDSTDASNTEENVEETEESDNESVPDTTINHTVVETSPTRATATRRRAQKQQQQHQKKVANDENPPVAPIANGQSNEPTSRKRGRPRRRGLAPETTNLRRSDRNLRVNCAIAIDEDPSTAKQQSIDSPASADSELIDAADASSLSNDLIAATKWKNTVLERCKTVAGVECPETEIEEKYLRRYSQFDVAKQPESNYYKQMNETNPDALRTTFDKMAQTAQKQKPVANKRMNDLLSSAEFSAFADVQKLRREYRVVSRPKRYANTKMATSSTNGASPSVSSAPPMTVIHCGRHEIEDLDGELTIPMIDVVHTAKEEVLSRRESPSLAAETTDDDVDDLASPPFELCHEDQNNSSANSEDDEPEGKRPAI